jgi:hypothetical protein
MVAQRHLEENLVSLGRHVDREPVAWLSRWYIRSSAILRFFILTSFFPLSLSEGMLSVPIVVNKPEVVRQCKYLECHFVHSVNLLGLLPPPSSSENASETRTAGDGTASSFTSSSSSFVTERSRSHGSSHCCYLIDFDQITTMEKVVRAGLVSVRCEDPQRDIYEFDSVSWATLKVSA